jgi:predicted transcriptional regulator
VESGLSDFLMMEKYGLTEKQLEYLLHKLMESGLVTKAQLQQRANLAETAVTKAFVTVQESIEELDDDLSQLVAHESTDATPERHEAQVEEYYRDALEALAQGQVTQPPVTPSSRLQPRKIKASELVTDITSGMTDPDLMLKYRIEPNQLEFMLRKLVEAGRLTHTQLVERVKITSTSITRAFVEVYQSLRELDEGEWTA